VLRKIYEDIIYFCLKMAAKIITIDVPAAIDYVRQQDAVLRGKLVGNIEAITGDSSYTTSAIQFGEEYLFDLFTGSPEFQKFLDTGVLKNRYDYFWAIEEYLREDFERTSIQKKNDRIVKGIARTVFDLNPSTYDNDKDFLQSMVKMLSINELVQVLFDLEQKNMGREGDERFEVTTLRAAAFIFEIIKAWPVKTDINPSFEHVNYTRADLQAKIINSGNAPYKGDLKPGPTPTSIWTGMGVHELGATGMEVDESGAGGGSGTGGMGGGKKRKSKKQSKKQSKKSKRSKKSSKRKTRR
jgi:hypothetical protein